MPSSSIPLPHTFEHTCLKTDIRPTDWIKGVSSPITFKANLSTGNWKPYFEFFERQKYEWDSNGCVLFEAQENFDAYIEFLIESGQVSDDTITWMTRLGYMDSVNSLDGKPHFHSSPRFLQILTGNGYNGNSLPDPWDVMRKYGVLPWTDLPFDATLTADEYIASSSITQAMYDKAQDFLVGIGGKNAIQYHWVFDGNGNLPALRQALQQAPVGIGVNVGTNWNVVTPPAPPLGSAPGHAVAAYLVDTEDGTWIYDHYEPNPKDLVQGYPIQYALQAVITITPPPPAPAAPDITNEPVNVAEQQTLSWLQKLLAWLGIINARMGSKVAKPKQ